MKKRKPQQRKLPMKISELVAAAELEVLHEYPVVVSDLGPAIDVLKRRNFAWKEMAEWFHERGMDYSPGSLAAGWNKWNKRNTNTKTDEPREAKCHDDQ